jgi:hypothetical protein
MSGPLENAEKFNTEIMQPLKKLPYVVMDYFSSTLSCISQALMKPF